MDQNAKNNVDWRKKILCVAIWLNAINDEKH